VSSVLRLRAPHPLHATLKPAFTIRKLARNPFAVSRLCHPSFTAGRTRFVELPQVHMSLVSCDGVAADAVCPPTMFEWYAPRIQMLITTKFQFQTRSTHHLPDAQLQVDQHVAVCASPRMDISRHRCQHQHLRRCLQRLAPHTDSRRHTDLVWTSGTRLVECGLQVLTSPRFAFFAPYSFLGLCSTTAATATAAPSQPFSHSRATVQPLTRNRSATHAHPRTDAVVPAVVAWALFAVAQKTSAGLPPFDPAVTTGIADAAYFLACVLSAAAAATASISTAFR
jgi:hypothetical protein